jgi:hypothetical protein
MIIEILDTNGETKYIDTQNYSENDIIVIGFDLIPISELTQQ